MFEGEIAEPVVALQGVKLLFFIKSGRDIQDNHLGIDHKMVDRVAVEVVLVAPEHKVAQ